MIEQAGKAAAAWAEPREKGEVRDSVAEPVTDMVKTFSKLTEYWLADPQRALEAQTKLFAGYMNVWANAVQRAGGEQMEDAVKPEKGDKRFQDPEWGRNAFFDFVKQAYLVTSRWAGDLAEQAEGLDEHTRHKASFYVKQVANAISPSNFILDESGTFPRDRRQQRRKPRQGHEDVGGGYRCRGRRFEAAAGRLQAVRDRQECRHDARQGGRTQRRCRNPAIRAVDRYRVEAAAADLSAVDQQVLHSRPQSAEILHPLGVEQGHTVFVISWINPDERHGMKGWEAYIREGLQYALDTVQTTTGEKEVNAIGYCVGGTLLAAALALLSQEGDDRIASVTFFTTQVDFTYAGDLKVFVDEDQIAAVEKAMGEKGYLDGTKMATAFNMLRSGDLIWPYVVNNYLRGKDPLPFDLLYWNADSTRMAAANHSFYLRNCYLENNLAKGRMEIAGHSLSLADIKIPVYNLSAKEDHIAPARSVFLGCRFFGGPVEFVMAGSGHIAGVVNPPAANKYQFWTGGPAVGDFDGWFAKADETPGSWWPHWQKWIEAQDASRVPAREPGRLGQVLGDAPGTYVKMRV